MKKAFDIGGETKIRSSVLMKFYQGGAFREEFFFFVFVFKFIVHVLATL